MNRRRLLAAAPVALVVAGTGVARARPIAESEQSALPFRRRLPSVASDGQPLEVRASVARVYQGGALRIVANPALSGVARLFGRETALQPAGNAADGFVAISTDDPIGPALVNVEVDGRGSHETVALSIRILATDWTVDYIVLVPGAGDLLDPAIVQNEVNRLGRVYGGVSNRRWTLPFLVPAEGLITAYFGEQRSFNGGPVSGHHGGTDIGIGTGTAVHATNDGRVVLAEKLDVRGNMVILDHGVGVFSGYAHLSEFRVAAGDVVLKGQVVGLSGATGLVSGPHLHWEMVVGGVFVDGLRWLDGTQGF